MSTNYPVVIIGAGPVGLATGAHLAERKQDFRILEAGSNAGAAMSSWGHIKLFSSWQYNIDAAARRLLETPIATYPGDWEAPRETRLPTGAEMVSEYLEPLASHPELAPKISYGHRVTQISRIQPNGLGADKTRSADRAEALFLVRTETATGTEDMLARAVIDASGTFSTPNPVGRSGIEAIGESKAHAAGFITSPLPDPLGVDTEAFAGKTILVLGAGHSAANTLISLGRLRRQHPETQILWGLRGVANPVRLYGGGAADELPARGQLGTSLRRLVENNDITLLENVAVTSMDSQDRLNLKLADGRSLVMDFVVPATGFRPDLSILSELRLDMDQIVEAPSALGPLIDPEFHSCGTVSAHGERELSHPEPGFYIVGMKSYGRAPTFLMATGYEQVRSIAAALAGDRAAADRVELQLPETGVCSTDLAGSCDAPAGDAVSSCGVPEVTSTTEDSCCGTQVASVQESSSCSTPQPAVAQPASCGTPEAEASSCGTPEPTASAESSCCGTPEPVMIGFATGTLHGHQELVNEDVK